MNKLMVTKGLSKAFQKGKEDPILLFDGIDFSIEVGERVAILGKSGAGKSTFLHVLGTLEPPTSGKVYFEGHDLFCLKETALAAFRNTQIGFVFQFHYLMLEFNALENVMMPGLIGGLGKKESKLRAEKLLEEVGLGQRKTHKPGELSGGEQQRVAIARALLMRPKLLLTDEMTGNLDSATGQQVMDLLLDLHSQYGMAMISVTHDDNLAQTYPKQYRLERGKLH